MAEYVNAFLTRFPGGASLRLSHRGFQIGSYRVPADAPDLTAAATEVLAGNGWRVDGAWDRPYGDEKWIADVVLAEES